MERKEFLEDMDTHEADCLQLLIINLVFRSEIIDFDHSNKLICSKYASNLLKWITM